MTNESDRHVNQAPIRDGIDRLLAQDPPLSALRGHGVHLLAADRWQRLGMPAPAQAADWVRDAAVAELAAGVILKRVRDTLRGPLLLLKGPELAVRYPRPTLRPFRDVDLLVPDATAARERLMRAGFVPVADVGAFARHHHEVPLVAPGMPLAVELHHGFWVPRWARVPPLETLIAEAVPSRTGIDGLSAFPPMYEAVLTAAHAWHHVPFRRLLDLVDIALLKCDLDPNELDHVATELNLGRLWRTTVDVADALLLDRRPLPWPLRTWARHLPELEAISVRRQRLLRWIGAAWAPDVPSASLNVVATAWADLRPVSRLKRGTDAND